MPAVSNMPISGFISGPNRHLGIFRFSAYESSATLTSELATLATPSAPACWPFGNAKINGNTMIRFNPRQTALICIGTFVSPIA